mgnify:CR=1 FL=1
MNPMFTTDLTGELYYHGSTESRQAPKSFVIAKFAETVRLLFPEIVALYYMIDRETHDEYVVTEYKTCIQIPGTEKYHEITKCFRINVSADSNAAMLEDVWRELKRRFY